MSQPPSRSFSCLIVDDDAGYAGMLASLVREAGGEPVHCPTVAEATREIARNAYEVVILDNRLPDGTGFEFYPRVAQRFPSAVVLMITGAPELSQAVELTRNGLFDYLTKPLDADLFLRCLDRVKRRLSIAAPAGTPQEMVGASASMAAVLQSLHQVARHPATTVLLLGETGTGKDLAARLLHSWTMAAAGGKGGEYVAVNCGSIPAEMFEAELFGSEKGAYTGSDRRRQGLVEAAEGGTLFLDEVAEIPLGLQAKLLRFLESREYRLLGNTATRAFSGRVVAATNRDLRREVEEGRFRADLQFRLDVFSVEMPPLRNHPEDIEPLSEHLLGRLAQAYGRRKPLLKPYDLERLRRHRFPGNVRELRNILERSLLKTPDEASTLHLDLPGSPPPEPGRATPPPHPASPVARPDLPPIEAQEYELIRQALEAEQGGIRRAATRLGLTHQALLRRLQKWPELRQE
jgi:two-component system response regulator AtoC